MISILHTHTHTLVRSVTYTSRRAYTLGVGPSAGVVRSTIILLLLLLLCRCGARKALASSNRFDVVSLAPPRSSRPLLSPRRRTVIRFFQKFLSIKRLQTVMLCRHRTHTRGRHLAVRRRPPPPVPSRRSTASLFKMVGGGVCGARCRRRRAVCRTRRGATGEARGTIRHFGFAAAAAAAAMRVADGRAGGFYAS